MKKYIFLLLINILLLSPLWLVSQADDSWKEEKQREWQSKEAMFTSQVSVLTDEINNNLYALKNNPEDGTAQTKALYAYNYLRGLLNRAHCSAFSEINLQWYEHVKEEAKIYQWMERYQCRSPTILQLYLVKKTQDLFKMNTIKAFSCDEGAFADVIESSQQHAAVVLSDIPDIDQQVGIIYHELGHIVHQDVKNWEAIFKEEKTLQEVMQESSFQSDITTVDYYCELGKKAFDTSTPIGIHVNKLLSEYTHFWIPPENEKDFQIYLYLRGREKRADLFAMKNLFKEKQLNIILTVIENYAFGCSYERVIASPDTDHPSDFERALYMTGFLVDKGLDINKAFRDWYSRGTCKAVPKYMLDILFSIPPRNQGANDFSEAYNRWQIEHEKKEYQTWKTEREKDFTKKTATMAAKVYQLTTHIFNSFSTWLRLTHDKREVLYAYNFLRELLKESPVTSWQEIDQDWLHEQVSLFWKEYAGQLRKEKDAKAVVNSINYWLCRGKEKPEHSYVQRVPLYRYNLLREILGENPIGVNEEIDHAWADKQLYQLWKERTQYHLQRVGITTLESQVMFMLNSITPEYQLVLKTAGDMHLERVLLYNYNLLRELVHESPVVSWKEIDLDWMQLQLELQKKTPEHYEFLGSRANNESLSSSLFLQETHIM